MTTVSIGLPVYNSERFLDETLDSLLGQTFADIEIVVCDNASQDGTEAIIRRRAARDGRIRYHRNPRNIGAIRNYNRTIALAQGEFYKLGSDDDLLAPTYIETCLGVLRTHPEIALAHPRLRYIDAEGDDFVFDAACGMYCDKLRRVFIEPPDDNYAGSPDPVARFHEILCRAMTFHQALGLVRTPVIRGIGGFGPYARSDRAFLAEMALYGAFCEIPQTLFFKREHHFNTRNLTPAQRRQWAGFGNETKLAEYRQLFRAILRSPLTPRDKLRCFGAGFGKLAGRIAFPRRLASV